MGFSSFILELYPMAERKFTLSKDERISWKRHIDLLFASGDSFIAFPFRIIYITLEEEMPAPVSIMVSVPKKKFKRAVKRNLIKRQAREAYRLQKYDLIDPITEKNKSLLVAFLYVDKVVQSVEAVEKGMRKAIRLLNEKIE
jgi:ribonuclease P protein component